ncbi:MAG: peptide ABC transporter substrate-binding protein, partial [Verrucomicrobiota bacterium]
MLKFLPVLALLLLLAACGGHQTPVEKATEEGILLLGNGTDPKALDPHITTGLVEFKVLTALFEGLTSPNPKTSAPEPGVAESWTTNEDMSAYTFKLRPDAKWSNGDSVTAEDFAFSYQRILSPAYAAEYASMLFPIKNARPFNQGELTDFSQVGVKALDKHTLHIELEGPTPHFPTMLGHNAYFPVHPPTILKYGEMTDRHTGWTKPGRHVSNGPFQLKAWKLNDRIDVERNPHYWDVGNVGLNGIAFLPITNMNTE